MAAHDDVSAAEHSGEHLRFGFRRHHFFAGRAINRHAARRVSAREELGDRNSGGNSHRTLRGVLVAMKRALGSAERIVFQNDAEIGSSSVPLPLC